MVDLAEAEALLVDNPLAVEVVVSHPHRLPLLPLPRLQPLHHQARAQALLGQTVEHSWSMVMVTSTQSER